jgi:translation elongation factor EF-1beta
MEVAKMYQELAEKEREDTQWNRYREAAEVKRNEKPKRPSGRQIAYIANLPKTVGVRIDISEIDSGIKASSLIEKLKMLSKQMNGSNVNELRDKRIAFGMAAKLVFKKYLDTHRDYRKVKRFWDEVDSFYKAYQLRQEQAVQA